MFVEFQVGSREKAFIVRNFHQRRKQASIDRLNVRPLLTARVSSQDEGRNQEIAAAEGGQRRGGRNGRNRKLLQASCERRSLSTYPSQGGRGDPFSPYLKPVAARLNMYLHHCSSVNLFQSRRPHCLRLVPIPRTRDASLVDAARSRIPSHAAGVCVPSSKAQGDLQCSQGVSATVIDRSNRDSIGFRIMALKTLNTLLRDPVAAATQSTVLLINSLVANEAFSANFQALQAHLEGLLTLISLLGGLDALDHILLSTVYQGFLIIGALQNTRPLLPMLRKFRRAIIHEPQIFGTEEIQYKCKVPAALHPRTLGARFNTAAWREDLHPTMRRHLEAFRRLIRHFELANLFFKCRSTNGPGLNEPLRLTLIIYLFTRVCDFQNLPMIEVMVETLRQSLDPNTAPDLLFWILFICGLASKGSSSHAWLVHHLASVALDLGLKEWMGDVRPLLGEFFYTDRSSQGRVETVGEDLWSEVVVFLRADPGYSCRHIAPRLGTK
ncbi:hypothetical protein BJY00DRAFT_301257 [Aspergillus carlsbadensis]|nr:hypothetical protein BJY00DRAFT_301257 [Aspergillus carlsbadensis]